MTEDHIIYYWESRDFFNQTNKRDFDNLSKTEFLSELDPVDYDELGWGE